MNLVLNRAKVSESISSIALSLRISRPTVRKHLKTEEEPVYQRQSQSSPKLGEFKAVLTQWLEDEAKLPKNQRCTAMRLFEGLVGEDYTGAYDSVQRFVKQWKVDSKNSPSTKQAFVPLVFKPGDVCQFDWSQEIVEIGGIEQIIKAAHFRLAFSRKMGLSGNSKELRKTENRQRHIKKAQN